MLVTAAVVSLGVVGVHASTECVRFIQKKVRHHRVSAETAARWAAWDKAHPNWHPKTPKEALAQLDFACTVPVIQQPVDGQLPPIEIGTFAFPMDMLPPPAPPTIVADNQPPPTPFADTPTQSIISPPIYTPVYPMEWGLSIPPEHVKKSTPPPSGGGTGPGGGTKTTPPPVVPEPSTWILLATAVFAMGGMAYRRPVTAEAIARR
jgi:hypothetical protein